MRRLPSWLDFEIHVVEESRQVLFIGAFEEVLGSVTDFEDKEVLTGANEAGDVYAVGRPWADDRGGTIDFKFEHMGDASGMEAHVLACEVFAELNCCVVRGGT